jgi:hypothetical protein
VNNAAVAVPVKRDIALHVGVATIPQGIPFRTTAPISAGSLLAAFLITGFVLTALVGGLVYARRRGWLARVTMVRPPPSGKGIDVIASRRLSMMTSAHVVAYQGVEYLVVESTRGSTASVAALGQTKADKVLAS